MWLCEIIKRVTGEGCPIQFSKCASRPPSWGRDAFNRLSHYGPSFFLLFFFSILSFSFPSDSVCLPRSSSLRVPPSPQQFIIITSPRCDGAHLRLIMCQHTHALTRTQEWDPLKPYYMSDCACNMGDYPWDCMPGQRARAGSWDGTNMDTHTHTYTHTHLNLGGQTVRNWKKCQHRIEKKKIVP